MQDPVAREHRLALFCPGIVGTRIVGMLAPNLNALQQRGFICLEQFHVHEIHHHIGPAIQQNNVTSNEHMGAIGRRGRQIPVQVRGARMNLFLQAWRQRSAAHQLLFKSGRQSVPLRKPRWKIVSVLGIPAVNVLLVLVVIAAIFVPIVVVAVLVVAFAVSVALAIALRHCILAESQTACERSTNHPFC